MRRPSGLTATVLTPRCGPSGCARRPPARSQTRTVPSPPRRETVCRPSGVTATATTWPVWPSRVCSKWSAADVPDPYGAVVTAGDGVPLVRGDGHRIDRAGVAFQGVFEASAGQVPDPYGAVAAAGDGVPAVGGDRHRHDLAGMAFPSVFEVVGGDVPDPYGAVVTAGDDVPAVGGDGHRIDRAGVAFQGAFEASAGQVPDPHGRSSLSQTMCRLSGVTATAFTPPVWPIRVFSRRPLARSQTRRCRRPGGDDAPAVGRDRHRCDPAGVAFQGAFEAPAGQVPDLHGPSSPPETMRRPLGVTAPSTNGGPREGRPSASACPTARCASADPSTSGGSDAREDVA